MWLVISNFEQRWLSGIRRWRDPRGFRVERGRLVTCTHELVTTEMLCFTIVLYFDSLLLNQRFNYFLLAFVIYITLLSKYFFQRRQFQLIPDAYVMICYVKISYDLLSRRNLGAIVIFTVTRELGQRALLSILVGAI